MSNVRLDVKKEETRFAQANLLYITSARFGGDWHSTPHIHACAELFFCIQGSGRFYIAGEYIDVGKDDLVVINPSVEHTEVSLSTTPLEYIVLGVDGVELIFPGREKAGFYLSKFSSNAERVELLLKNMMCEMEQQLEWHESICKNCLEMLLVYIFRHTEYKINAAPLHPSKECSNVKRYLDENYTENITLEDLAEFTHLNKYYLVHAFSNAYNVSPINYLIQRRIRESKYLLANTNHPLAQISNLVGFSSPSYFSQSFGKLEKMSPGEYRKRQMAKAKTIAITKTEED